MSRGALQARTLRTLQLQWGWITPGTCVSHRRGQWEAWREFLAQPMRPETRRLLATHCGWWLDADASPWVRDLTRRNPEPNRALEPCRAHDLDFLRCAVRNGRLELIAYPYAANVAEALTGEGLFRALRSTLEILEKHLGVRARVLMTHDAVYDLDWGCPQMPQIVRLLGRALVVAGEDGIVIAPEGTSVRAFGSVARWYEALARARPGGAPVFFSSELHEHLRLMEDMARRRLSIPLAAPVETVGLDAYLAAKPARRKLPSRRMGTKSWHGGVCDALLMEQFVNGVELRLPAIEAAGILGGTLDDAARARLRDLWKGAWILMDSSTLWQCHDYRRHYLPRSARFAREAASFEKRLLGHRAKGRKAYAFNPTPWRRDAVIETSRGVRYARGVPGWGAKETRLWRSSLRGVSRSPHRLAAGEMRCDLSALGEVVRVARGARTREFEGLGRLVEFREKPSRERMPLSRGEALAGFAGSATLSCEAELPKGARAVVFSAEISGEAFLLQAERRGGSGRETWHALHHLHWGGYGLPRHEMKVGPVEIPVEGARRLRLTLWTLAEGRLVVRKAWLSASKGGRRQTSLDRWEAQMIYRVEMASARLRHARVVRDLGLLAVSRFEGELPSCRWTLFATLRAGSDAVAYRLRLHFPKPTRLGLSTPPFSEDEGSLLGAQCERPYVPGVAALFPLPGRARYFSDKPWSLEEALRSAPRTWHTDRRDWWLGMSPFLGTNLAVADWGRGKLALLTRGLKHFFRQRKGGREALGLSFGATLIHPMTQGHSVPRTSRFFSMIGRRDHDPYERVRFLRAHGIYEFHYAVRPSFEPEEDLAADWRAAREFALPPTLFRADRIARGLAGGAECAARSAALSALEKTDHGRLLVRAVNLEGRPLQARVNLPGLGRTMRIPLPSFAVREAAAYGVGA